MQKLTTSQAATAISPEPQERQRAEQAPADGAREHTAPGAARIIEQLDANHTAASAAGLGGPDMDAFHNVVRQLVSESDDPEATFGAIAQLIIERSNANACPLYRDCTVTGPHYDHMGGALKVTDSTDGSTVLDAGMVANSGSDKHAIVYVRNAEFTDVASVRAKTAELRSFLDEVDALAERVFNDHKGRV